MISIYENILWLWVKVGFVPFTRSCIKNRKVRKELVQVDKDTVLEDIHENYDVLIEDFKAKGFNPGIYDSVIPTAVQV